MLEPLLPQHVSQILEFLHLKNPKILQENTRSISIRAERNGKPFFLKVLASEEERERIEQDILIHNFLAFVQLQKPDVLFRVPKIIAYDTDWFLSEYFEAGRYLPEKKTRDIDVSFEPEDFAKNLGTFVQLYRDTDITIGWHNQAQPLYLDFSGKQNHLWRQKRKEITGWVEKAVGAKVLSQADANRLFELIKANLPHITIAWEHGELWPNNCYNLGEKIGLIDFDRGRLFGARFFDVVRMYLVLRTKQHRPDIAKEFLKSYLVHQTVGLDAFMHATVPLIALKLLGGAHDMSGYIGTNEYKLWEKEFKAIKDEILSDEPEKLFT